MQYECMFLYALYIYKHINYLPGICSLNLDETEFHALIMELQPSHTNLVVK